MAKIFQKGPPIKQAERRKMNFEVKNTPRLGTRKAPAQISVFDFKVRFSTLSLLYRRAFLKNLRHNLRPVK